jgi:hypothetical protein
MSEIKSSGGATSDFITTKMSDSTNNMYTCSVDYASLTTFLTFDGAWTVTQNPELPLVITTSTTPSGTRFGFCFQNISSYIGQCIVSSPDYGSQTLTISFPWSHSAP